jgi:FolB domain-containing protein
MDVIEIEGLRLRCVIGVRAEERRDRSDVVVDLRIGTSVPDDPDDLDAVGAVWDYRIPTKAVIAAVEASRFQTVERLAWEIARVIVVDHGAPCVDVRVAKPGALRFADTVAVRIRRQRQDFANRVPATTAAAGRPA